MIEKAEGMGINDFVEWYTTEYANALEIAQNYTE